MTATHRAKLVSLLGLLLGLGWIAGFLQNGSDNQPIVEDGQALPPGFWVRDPGGAKRDPGGAKRDPGGARHAPEEGEQTAQMLSLPYTAGGAPAPNQTGVVYHDPDKAWPGLNLYVSGHGSEVILVDMEGRFLHRWRRSFRDIFPDRQPGPETDFIRRAQLLDDGSLVVLFQGGGLARLDWHSEIQWTAPGAFFNDLHVTGSKVYAIGKTARQIPELRPGGEVLEDFLAVLDLDDGRRLERHPLWSAFIQGGFDSLLGSLPDTADIFHSNTVTPLSTVPDQQTHPAFTDGNFLISLREIHTVAVLDSTFQKILWAHQGPWVAQHEPVLLPDGHLLVFDNKGGIEGRSRILVFDPFTSEVTWQFEHPSFHSPQAGTVQPLPNGNILITSSEQGRVFELTLDGDVAWEMVSPHRAGRDLELVASLFEVQRLPMNAAASRLDR